MNRLARVGKSFSKKQLTMELTTSLRTKGYWRGRMASGFRNPKRRKRNGVSNVITKKLPACGNPKCSCSAGVAGHLTFGSGKLDEYGYWECPCRVCAIASDAERVHTIYKMMQDAQNKAPAALGYSPEQLENCISQCEWLFYPAWPTKG